MRVNEVDYHYFVRFGLSLCTLSRIRALSVCSTIRAKIRHASPGYRAACTTAYTHRTLLPGQQGFLP